MQPSRKLINSACCLRAHASRILPAPPASCPHPPPRASLSGGFPPPLLWICRSPPRAFQPRSGVRDVQGPSPGAQGRAAAEPGLPDPSVRSQKLHPRGPRLRLRREPWAAGLACASLRLRALTWNKLHFKFHQLSLSFLPCSPANKVALRSLPLFFGNLSRQQIAGGNYAAC